MNYQKYDCLFGKCQQVLWDLRSRRSNRMGLWINLLSEKYYHWILNHIDMWFTKFPAGKDKGMLSAPGPIGNLSSDVRMWKLIILFEPRGQVTIHQSQPYMCCWKRNWVISKLPVDQESCSLSTQQPRLFIVYLYSYPVHHLGNLCTPVFINIALTPSNHDTHLPPVPHICVGELGHYWFR